MNPHFTRRHRLLAAGAALCCGPFLAVPAAQAASPFDPSSTLTSSIGLGLNSGVSPSGTCTTSGPTSTSTPPAALVTNHPAVSAGTTIGITGTNSGDGTDTITTTANASAKAWLRSSGSNPTSVDLTLSGTTVAVASKPVSACTAQTSASLGATTKVVLNRPTVVTTDASGRGSGGYLWAVVPGSSGLSGTLAALGLASVQSSVTHTTMYLPAGEYTVIAAGVLAMSSNHSQATRAGTARVHIAFAAAGSRTAARQMSYVTMPASRSCTTHKVSPRITTNAKKAKQIKSVAFRVNGKLVKTVKAPHKGTTFKLTATDDQAATVTATAKLRNGKTVTSTASYLQCS